MSLIYRHKSLVCHKSKDVRLETRQKRVETKRKLA